MDNNFVEMQLTASQWACAEADKLIKQYKACKTEHARNRLRPRLDEIRRKLSFEGKGIDKLMEKNNEGEEWKNQG